MSDPVAYERIASQLVEIEEGGLWKAERLISHPRTWTSMPERGEWPEA